MIIYAHLCFLACLCDYIMNKRVDSFDCISPQHSKDPNCSSPALFSYHRLEFHCSQHKGSASYSQAYWSLGQKPNFISHPFKRTRKTGLFFLKLLSNAAPLLTNRSHSLIQLTQNKNIRALQNKRRGKKPHYPTCTS
eukprot:TRINITY_DN33941_c0_g1_i1.p1 TRINITY_DN33941_c0_g1~~TRINITY_DN33941_c0_g1_i1.p1  ORF type:complete len:137 (-),score=5.06 TRINITY_DN33941_c0_g1_i1:648-1058(-)